MKIVFGNVTPEIAEKLLNFVYPDEKDMTYKEVKAELKRLNIDTSAAWAKLKKVLDSKKPQPPQAGRLK